METDLNLYKAKRALMMQGQEVTGMAAGCTLILTKHFTLSVNELLTFYILLVSLKVTLTCQQTLKPPDYV